MFSHIDFYMLALKACCAVSAFIGGKCSGFYIIKKL